MAKECSVCVWERRTGKVIDTSRSQREWARKIPTSEASVRRHLRHKPRAEENPAREEIPENASQLKQTWTGTEGELSLVITGEEITKEAILRKFGHDPEKVSIVGTLEESHWMMHGEWQHRYRFRTERKISKQGLDELFEAIKDFSFTPIIPRENSGTFVITPADMQIGKTDYNGGTRETLERVGASYAQAVEFVKDYRPEHIIIGQLGDSIENIYNVSSQRETNDLHLTDQVRVARRADLEGIKMLSPYAPKLTYAAVPSNHGTHRIGPKSPAGNSHDDWGIEIAEAIADVISNSAALGHVDVFIPELHEEALVIESSGTKIGMVHGHQAGSPDKIGQWWKGQSHGRRPVAEADILLVGHFHSLRVQHSGDARWILVSPASDPGSSWFTNATGESALSGMLSFTAKDGRWDNLKIL